jgi:hypothetical protein
LIGGFATQSKIRIFPLKSFFIVYLFYGAGKRS